MSDPFLAEIRIFAGSFAPTGWAQCNGQLMPISQNTALFSLLGTMYGGDGKSTFALPNLQASVPIGQGQGPGLTDRFIGESAGAPNVTLLTSEMPIHNHLIQGSTEVGELKQPAPTEFLAKSKAGTNYQSNVSTNLVTMHPQTLSLTGGSLPHNNLQPFLALTYIIALQGIFPPRG
ncbi:phage tail protein [Bradyrhizobium sp. GCM10027634]|uniref:phage tail protein n=1 Tax=unclassified Bradyrhizobium TaxID=2631580 RepID=UPI00188B3F2D|nr:MULTISPECIES: tail fiber protein [unclassified Bradyrhizobium]MDN5000404.1 tail fiber protein [Bradyrhizobium sp. WYCCWR 12677]QOZ42839.1 phage tail protein [Bradyrhizobium sp. CCBAU 53340]